MGWRVQQEVPSVPQGDAVAWSVLSPRHVHWLILLHQAGAGLLGGNGGTSL